MLPPIVLGLWVPISLGAILVVAGVLRIYDIGANPAGFFADEASYGYNAYSILHTGKDEHGQIAIFFEAFGEYKLPVYTYSLIPFVLAFGLTEVAVRLTTAVFGIVTVLAVYLLVRELFRQEPLAVASAAIFAVLPWHVHYSRTGLGEIPVHVLFVVLGLYLFLLGNRRPEYWLLSSLAFVLAIFSYRAAWVLVPLLVLALAVLYYRELRANWQFALASCIPLALAAIAILMHLLLAGTDRATDQWIFGLDLGVGGTVTRFASQYFSHFDPGFLFADEQENLRHVVPGTGWLFWWQAPFVLIGVLAMLFRPCRPTLLVLGLFLAYPVAAAVTVDSPNTSRTLFGAVAFSIATAYGLTTAVRVLMDWNWGPSLRLAGISLTVTLLVATAVTASIQLVSYLDTYHGSYQQTSTGWTGWQWGARQIVEHFESVEDDYDTLVMDGYAVFNAPEIFFAFYAPNGCKNCVVGNFAPGGWPDEYDHTKRQLFAIEPWRLDWQVPYVVKGELISPSGQVAFVFAEIASNGVE